MTIYQLQASSADDTGIVAQGRDANLCLLFVILGESFFLDDRAQGSQKVVALTRDTAADAQYIGLEDIDDIDESRRQIADILLYDLSAGRIACLPM